MADQVMGDHLQTKHSANLFNTAQLGLAQSAPLLLLRRRLRLDPGKHHPDAPGDIDRLGRSPRGGWCGNHQSQSRLDGRCSEPRWA
jgi:hypothetical protein